MKIKWRKSLLTKNYAVEMYYLKKFFIWNHIEEQTCYICKWQNVPTYVCNLKKAQKKGTFDYVSSNNNQWSMQAFLLIMLCNDVGSYSIGLSCSLYDLVCTHTQEATKR